MKAPAINGLNLEGSAMALWQEWLAGFFDGGTHFVGPLAGVVFPKAVVRFQEAVQLPLQSAVGISVVWVAPSAITMKWDTLTGQELAALPAGTVVGLRQQRATAHTTFLFLVRAVEAGGSATAQKQVADAAGLLFALLQNPLAAQPLSRKGLHWLRPMAPRMAWQGDGAPTMDDRFHLRVIACRASLRYPVVSQLPDLRGGPPYTWGTVRMNASGLFIENSVTGLWHQVLVSGTPEALGVEETGAQWGYGMQDAGSPDAGCARINAAGQLQLRDAVTDTWNTVLVSGTPAELGLAAGGMRDAGCARFNVAGQLQLENTTTRLWHTVVVSGTPAEIGIEETGTN
jgi:hypothetical protein